MPSTTANRRAPYRSGPRIAGALPPYEGGLMRLDRGVSHATQKEREPEERRMGTSTLRMGRQVQGFGAHTQFPLVVDRATAQLHAELDWYPRRRPSDD